jgi:hypothetical protein
MGHLGLANLPADRDDDALPRNEAGGRSKAALGDSRVTGGLKILLFGNGAGIGNAPMPLNGQAPAALGSRQTRSNGSRQAWGATS